MQDSHELEVYNHCPAMASVKAGDSNELGETMMVMENERQKGMQHEMETEIKGVICFLHIFSVSAIRGRRTRSLVHSIHQIHTPAPLPLHVCDTVTHYGIADRISCGGGGGGGAAAAHACGTQTETVGLYHGGRGFMGVIEPPNWGKQTRLTSSCLWL